VKHIEIHPIPLVSIDAEYEKPKMTYLFNYGQNVNFYYYVWFLEAGAKKILVDAGGTAEMAIALGRPRESVKHVQTLEEGFAKLGLKPVDIDIVILTHLHLDHLAYARQFTNAKFIVQEDELNFARNPHPAGRFYEKGLFEGLDFEVVNGDYQITEGVKVLFTPGHTSGGQSVAVETAKGIAVITGLCCIQENFQPSEEIRKVMPVIVPGVHLDVIKSYDSMIRIKEIADIIIENHDPRFANVSKIP